MSIIREIRFETSGNKDSVSQVFCNNLYAESEPVVTTFSSLLKPKFTTYGGTLDYYSQDPYAIFTNLVRPPIRFVFSANTAALTGESYFIHNIYRIDYETFKLYGDNQIDSKVQVVNKEQSESLLGNVPKNLRETTSLTRTINGNNLIKEPEKYFGQPLTKNDLAKIQSFLTTPIITITASTAYITGNFYDLNIDQFIKRSGKFKTELFLDKAQYFIDTHLVTFADIKKDYSDFSTLSGNKIIKSSWINKIELNSTNSYPYTINKGLFSGITLSGNYFTYFIVPDKPVFEYPIPSGNLTTFTPEFRWSNGDNADSFILQINYDVKDVEFTGNLMFNYMVPKNEKNLKVSRSRIKFPDSEFESEKAIYTFQVPVKSAKAFIYRVGNSKEIIDIFNVRRNVITFSDIFTANSQDSPIKIYVETETDSPFVPSVSEPIRPPSLDYESPISLFNLQGTISGSIVTGATIQLTYPNSSFITATTDSTGFFYFSGLSSGNYTITTSYRGYESVVKTINIFNNTSYGFDIQTLWDNPYDTWQSKENDIIIY